MRVAFLVNEFPAISETFVLDQLTGLIDRGCEVDVYAQRLHRDAVAHPSVKSYRLMDRATELAPPPVSSRAARALHGLRDVGLALAGGDPVGVSRSLNPVRFGVDALKLKPFYRVRPFLARRRYDIFNCHFGPNGVLGVELRDLGLHSAPVVTHFHGYDATSYVQAHGRGVYERLFASGDLFLCDSARIVKRLVDLGSDASRTFVHRTGSRVKELALTSHEPGPGEALRVLTVGRLVEKKGIEFGLRAIATLAPTLPGLSYTVIGEGPERAALTELTRRLGLEQTVRFAGAQPRDVVGEHMRTAHLLLAPSVAAKNGDEEGVPVVLMEALASGLPVVTTRHAGIPELVVHGVTGLLSDERDPEGLAAQVRFLVEHPDERRAMVAAGRRVVEEEYDVDGLNSHLYATFEQLLARRRPGAAWA